MNAIFWLKKEGYKPKRDIVIVLFRRRGNEPDDDRGARAAAETAPSSSSTATPAGARLGDEGKPEVYSMQAAEKTYMDFEVTTTNPGGHSSRPGPTNAIYDLARAIDKVAAFRFPAQLSELTKAYFKAAGPLTPGPTGEAMLRYADNPKDKEAYDLLYSQSEYVGQLGTTCVATMLRGGHAPNALPQSATANINCRVFRASPSNRAVDARERRSMTRRRRSSS
jgi:acetylornithine deacetylase/succinyl-diaminopimelate desuccinylase-like protein